MARGTVKWFRGDKGYGFLTPDGTDAEDVFVHHTQICMEGFRCLVEGQTVEYTPFETSKGKAAADVRVVQDGSHG